jgi:hypothetical protein
MKTNNAPEPWWSSCMTQALAASHLLANLHRILSAARWRFRPSSWLLKLALALARKIKINILNVQFVSALEVDDGHGHL